MKNIAILFGGKSSEYKVSLSSAYALLSNIKSERYNLHKIGITSDGAWFLYCGSVEDIPTDRWLESCEKYPITFSPNNNSRTLYYEKGGESYPIVLDAVFPMLHGKFGEDGQIQGLFSVMGVPVVGCGHASSAVCMDKAMTKAIVKELRIPQAKSVTMREGDDIDKTIAECEGYLGYPMFVKPCCAGSSVGISKVRTREQLVDAIAIALKEDSKLLIEEMISGGEFEVAVLEEHGRYTVSVPAEIDVGSSDFYDYETKYVSDASSYYIPARLTPDKTSEIRVYAEQIFRALDCKGFSRVDFFYTPEGRFVFNEINTIPGFTPISMYPKLMVHTGFPYSELIDRLIASAL